MEYEFVLKRDGKEIFREKGDKKIEQVFKELDELVVKQK
jgi:hypothetical protein